jgi:hypothetical protein
MRFDHLRQLDLSKWWTIMRDASRHDVSTHHDDDPGLHDAFWKNAADRRRSATLKNSPDERPGDKLER